MARNAALNKRRIIERVEITSIADQGKGIGRDPEGMVIFVEKVALGDVVDLLILKKKKDYLEATPIAFHKLSADRAQPFCTHFGTCGGCKWQHVTYEAQLRYKFDVVEAAIRRIGKVPVQEILPIKGAASNQYYRNKLEYTFSNKQWLDKAQMEAGLPFEQNVLGFHRPGAFDKIVDIQHCYLQPDPSNALRNQIREIANEQNLSFWDARLHKGFLRHIMIRISTIGESMLIVSFSYNDPPHIKRFLDEVIRRFPTLTTLLYCINPKVNDYVLDLEMIRYHGKGYIEEQLGHVRFRIGPKSFFQTNTQQAKTLYDVVEDFAQFDGTENVYDLYTGLGSIAQYVAHRCKQVTGIDEVEAAIADARKNVQLNGIDNCSFHVGDVKDLLTTEFAKKHGKPDLIISDPPRAGMHKDVLETILKLEASRVIYVSCNPATQARDLNFLHQKYDILKIQPVDMFPHTHHIESVALLHLRENKKPILGKIKTLLGLHGS